MSIYEYKKNGKTHYYYSFEVKNKDGKRKTIKKRGFKTKGEARKGETEAKVAWDKGNYIDPSKMTYGEYVNDWLKKKQNVSEQTRHTNEGHIRNHINPLIGHIPLQKLSVHDIEDFINTLDQKKLASGTVKKIYNLVQTSLKAAEKKELISRNPIDLLDDGSKPRVEKGKVDFWTPNEAKQFLNRFEHRQKILFVLAIYTGMRRGEILGLRWKDIDFNTAQIRISQILGFKGKLKDGAKTTAGNRSITVPPVVIGALKEHYSKILSEKASATEYFDHDLVICQTNGKPISWGNFHKFWKRILAKSELREIRFHDLRHTCASLLFSAGVHPKIVQEQLGHSSIKVTLDTYSHMLPNMQADAAKALENILK